MEVAFSAQAVANPTWALQAAPAIPATLATAPTSLEVVEVVGAAEPLAKVVALISMVGGAKSVHSRDLVAVRGNSWRSEKLAARVRHFRWRCTSRTSIHFIVITFLTKISL
jgi:hypothetical protein